MHLAVPPPAPQSITTEDERLIRDHLGLVGYVVAEVVARIPRHVDRDDLLSAATVGLVQAARSFDPDRGISFQSYARIRIRGAVVDELRSRDWASRSVRRLARRAESAADALALRLGRSPTLAEVADGLGIDPEVLRRLAADVQRASTINYEGLVLTGDADTLLPADVDTPQEALLERERRGYLHDAIVSLPPRLRRVVVGYFFEERPIAALAAELGVSESRISQMRAEAVALLRDAMNAHLEPRAQQADHRSRGRVARRKAAYYDAVGSASGYRARLDARPRPLTQRVALAGVEAA